MNMLSKFSNTLVNVGAAALVLTCTLAAGGAIASPLGEEQARETVKYRELNLDNPAGVAVLYGRIHAAALRVCTSGYRDLSRMDKERACIRSSEDAAVKHVNVDALTGYLQMKRGESSAKFAGNVTK